MAAGIVRGRDIDAGGGSVKQAAQKAGKYQKSARRRNAKAIMAKK